MLARDLAEALDNLLGMPGACSMAMADPRPNRGGTMRSLWPPASGMSKR
jgi:hypothetical protein